MLQLTGGEAEIFAYTASCCACAAKGASSKPKLVVRTSGGLSSFKRLLMMSRKPSRSPS